MRIAVVSCYAQTDYVRAVTLRAAVKATPDTEMIDIRNRHRGLLRYPEVLWKVWRARWRQRPDAWLITFRGYEMLLLMRLSLIRQPIIFDELVNFTEWLEEHEKLQPDTWRYRRFRRWYGRLVGRCRIVLADTDAHATYSAELNSLPPERYMTIPVAADETLFKVSAVRKPAEPFTVLYYGSMLPLHGLDYVLQAAATLKSRPDIVFRLIGGKQKVRQACEAAAASGAHVTYEPWLPFDELPQAIAAAGLVLGGPFGDTLQSQFVITNKTTQAVAAGAPVLIGKNRVNSLFKDKVNCLMVPQADAEAIAGAIIWAQDRPQRLEAVAIAGRQLYERHFSQETVNNLIRQLLAELK